MSERIARRVTARCARRNGDGKVVPWEPPAAGSAKPAAGRREGVATGRPPGEARRPTKARAERRGGRSLSPAEVGRQRGDARVRGPAVGDARHRSARAAQTGREEPGVRESIKRAEEKRSGPRPWVRRALVVMLLASLGLILWVYMYTGVLNVKEVEVRGNRRLDACYLRALSGITSQTHLLRMDVGAVERALLSEPYVAEVKVGRRFPYTVILQVSEKEPMGMILQNGKYHLVDDEGMVVESRDTPEEGLVEIQCRETRPLYPGVILEDANFPEYAAMLREMPQGLREITVVAGFQEGEGFYLEAEGTRVIVGEIKEVSRKMEIAYLALREIAPRYGKLAYVDVTYPDHPAIKPAE